VGGEGENVEAATGSSEGRDRPRTLSAAYLEQAVDALSCAGNPAVLFRGHRKPPPEDATPDDIKRREMLAFMQARHRHMTHSRNAVLCGTRKLARRPRAAAESTAGR
jgi:hypothetical protein